MPVPVRARVLGFAFLLAVITYLDRVCISAAAPYIMDDLHLSVLQMSVVFSAFTLSYSLFEIPSGWLGDVKGPRRVLTRIVLWWSAFTMLTGRRARICVAGGDSVPVRRGGSGRLSEHRAKLLALVSGARARPRQRRHVSRLADGRHALGADRAADRRPLGLAHELRDLRPARRRLGGGMVRVVPRSARTSIRRSAAKSWRGSSRMATPATATRPAPAHRGARSFAAATSTRSARCTSRSATGCTSTSRGCRRI